MRKIRTSLWCPAKSFLLFYKAQFNICRRLLLSFRHAIEYGKPLYIGSVNAVERYETLLLKIDLRLGLVDEATLKKARVKLQREGVAPVWQI